MKISKLEHSMRHIGHLLWLFILISIAYSFERLNVFGRNWHIRRLTATEGHQMNFIYRYIGPCCMCINYHHCRHHHTNRILHSSYFIIGCCLRAIFVLCTEHKPDSIRTSSSINHIYVDMHVCAANAIVHLSLSMGECYFSRFVF